MPREIRKIVFTGAELQGAVVSHCLQSNIPFPDAAITGFEVGDDPEATVEITFAVSNPEHPATVRLTREQVAAALIRFCREHKIPLPRYGQKILQPQADGLALMVKVELVVKEGGR